ncbi:hypothetical protein ACQ86N_26930 [Puia sp. P3]|uniref:hypothetical protein n=1 Tax=Puia sp. P3 TaxID=3423952 RepID=UPI003D67F355
MTEEEEAEHGDQEPVVGAVQGVFEAGTVIPGHAFEAEPHKKRCESSEKEIL